MLFAEMRGLALAMASMIVFGLFVHMAAGATYAVVPFVNRRALGSVAGIVGAGGNAGAVAAGFLFRTPTDWWPAALLILGAVVTGSAGLALLVRFPEEGRVPALDRVPETADRAAAVA
jgi:NNP family nitrate/nitrite transporter-like MFS transporter